MNKIQWNIQWNLIEYDKFKLFNVPPKRRTLSGSKKEAQVIQAIKMDH